MTTRGLFAEAAREATWESGCGAPTAGLFREDRAVTTNGASRSMLCAISVG